MLDKVYLIVACTSLVTGQWSVTRVSAEHLTSNDRRILSNWYMSLLGIVGCM